MIEKKIEIEWHSLIRDVVRNIWVVFCAALIGLMGTYILKQVVYKPEYTSSASLIINSAAGKANAVASLSQSSEIAQIYTEVFVQPSMKDKVCELLGKQKFDGDIKAYVNSGTNIMELSVTASNPVDAYKELSAILKVYPKLTSSLFNNGVVSILRTPFLPKFASNNASSEHYRKNACICILISLIMIVALSVFRDTVKDEKSFNEKIESKLFGIIPHESKHLKLSEIIKGKKQGILINESAFTSLKFTENFNKIAAKLEYMKRKKGMSAFCITSVAENEGKSTISSNIAISLALKGNRVVLLDLDGKKPVLYKIFSEQYDEKAELANVLSGEVPLNEYKFRRFKKTKLFLALNTRACKEYKKWIETGRIEKIISALRKSADYIIVDTAPVSVDSSVTDIAKICDAALLVVRTDTVYAPVINDAILTFSDTGANLAGCILNDCYSEFSMFRQFGTDESGYTGYGRYSKYSRYSKYGSYGKYGRYAHLAADTADDLRPEDRPVLTSDIIDGGSL